jgi:uncharacterized protein (DUF305 family)
MLKKFTLLAALLAAMSVMAACGTDDNASEPATQRAASGDEFNGADVEFATDMIQHHAQALSMVDLTIGRQLDPEFQQVAEGIRAAQGPEIEQMTDWLTDWDQPIPETMRDHANAHGESEMEMDSDMPGTMSAEEMAGLEAAKGAEFQQMWLEMMIEHHEGAIEMAQTEQSEGNHADAIELAGTIESTQQEEISTMGSLLGS